RTRPALAATSACGEFSGTPQFGQAIEAVVNSPKHKGQTPVVRGDTSSTVAFWLAMLSAGASFSNPSLAESRIHFAMGKLSSQTQTSKSASSELPDCGPFTESRIGGYVGTPSQATFLFQRLHNSLT